MANNYEFRLRRMHKQSYYGYLSAVSFAHWCDAIMTYESAQTGSQPVSQPAASSQSIVACPEDENEPDEAEAQSRSRSLHRDIEPR